MHTALASLRTRLRSALAAAGREAARLADLDAALQGILGEREHALLAVVPLRLEKRFEDLRHSHGVPAGEPGASGDGPAQWLQPGGWLATFCGELQELLLAELDLRFQPAEALLAALHGREPRVP
jgi:hypothetical protein